MVKPMREEERTPRAPADGAGRRAIRNAWITIPDPYLVEIVASHAAIDAVTIDMQHGFFGRESAVEAIRAVAGLGKSALIRLPDGDEALIGFLLDAGASGLIQPGVESADQAAALVAASRYPPSGRRSFGPTRAALTAAAERPPLLFAMIETAAGLKAVPQIASVDGLDGIFVGPGDLGIALGLGPAQDRSEPEFIAALDTIVSAARQGRKLLGIHATTPTYAERMWRQGFTLVSVWVDVTAIKRTLAEVEQVWRGSGADV
jgi:4-hydroxy-2-oxoheptanedioate aldolase